MTLMRHDDRVKSPQGVPPTSVTTRTCDGQRLSAGWPDLLGYNRVVAKPDADVLARVGGDPLMVAGSFGKGGASPSPRIAGRTGRRRLLRMGGIRCALDRDRRMGWRLQVTEVTLPPDPWQAEKTKSGFPPTR